MTKYTKELLERLSVAQLKHVHQMTDSEGIEHAQWSTDAYDYLKGALNLGHELLVLDFDQDLDTFRKLFDPKSDAFIPLNYACDGVCEEIWKLIPEDWFELSRRPEVEIINFLDELSIVKPTD